MHELLGSGISDFVINVYGTDIDKECIQKAKLGEYRPESLKKVSEQRIKKYFHFTGNSYRIDDSVKLITRFMYHNMVLDRPIVHVDMIVCRNVLIYFTRKLQEEIFQKFYQALNRDGYLILGNTENLWGETQNLFKPLNIRERIYQKKYA